MSAKKVKELVVRVLDDKKGLDVVASDVRQLTDMADFMVFASGNTARQVKALANEVVAQAKARGVHLLSVEGMDTGEWVLVDLADVVVHILQPATRDFYRLEELWVEQDSAQPS